MEPTPGRKLRIDELERPHHHWRILECVEDFANPRKQERWRRNDPTLPRFDTLDETWNALGDHAVFNRDCRELVGYSLRDELEADALNALTEALTRITEALGRGATPGQCFDHPQWPEVIRTAQKAERLLRRGDYT